MPRGPHWFHRRIRGYGCRLTLPRQRILEVLSRSSKHLSAEEISHRVHQVYPAIGLTTVYRTLEMLISGAMVMKFDFGDGRTRYELIKDQGALISHHHLICRVCLKIIDCAEFTGYERGYLESIKKKLSKKYKFEIREHQTRFYGVCEKCKKEVTDYAKR